MDQALQPSTRPWAQPGGDVAAALHVDAARGLPAAEVALRRARFGDNALREAKPRRAWVIFVAQFRSLLVGLLGAAVIAAFAFGEWIEGGAIAVVLVLNSVLGFATELRAARSMEALRKMGATLATVRRDGEVDVVDASELVPGDIVVLAGGDIVTADVRLLESSRLQVNESTFTGESLPVSKGVDPVDPDAAVADRRSMLFKGTIVTRGAATGVVVATGMACELGKIARLVEEAREEETPLERRLQRLGRGLVGITLVLAALVAVAGYVAGKPPLLVIETSIALAVAAVPEGLPIIATIALARGMHRMARHEAVVNRLSAVETLGATNIICTDKTGTLTENRMTVDRVEVPEGVDRRRALEVGVLCNDADLDDDDTAVGDPLEIALLRAGAREGILREQLLDEAPERREVAFDHEVKMMATVHGRGPPYRIAVKGAPEAVLARCNLPDAETWHARAESLAADGRRVLAVAERRVDDDHANPYDDLTFVGLIGMLDPPRAEVRETIEACHRAGIRVIMATGDHPRTAAFIARATGVTDAREPDVVLGRELETADSATRARLRQAVVFARVSPKQKLDLVTLHQRHGDIVAMTGDGVNDAPALRKAQIGVAMGARGTSAAKEAADMVLADDDLSTIVVAISEGRVIFDNIRNFVVYLLSCNISEVLVVALAAFARAPLPLLPLQILFLNVVTDVFPALALGVGRADRDVMRRPPRSPTEPVIAPRHWLAILAYGLVLTASVLGAFALALADPELTAADAVTVSFATLAFGQLWHVLNMRRAAGPVLRNEITRNRSIWGAIALCVILLGAAIYLPPLARVLSLTRPGPTAWLLIAAMSLAPVLVALPAKWVAAAWTRRHAAQ